MAYANVSETEPGNGPVFFRTFVSGMALDRIFHFDKTRSQGVNGKEVVVLAEVKITFVAQQFGTALAFLFENFFGKELSGLEQLTESVGKKVRLEVRVAPRKLVNYAVYAVAPAKCNDVIHRCQSFPGDYLCIDVRVVVT